MYKQSITKQGINHNFPQARKCPAISRRARSLQEWWWQKTNVIVPAGKGQSLEPEGTARFAVLYHTNHGSWTWLWREGKVSTPWKWWCFIPFPSSIQGKLLGPLLQTTLSFSHCCPSLPIPWEEQNSKWQTQLCPAVQERVSQHRQSNFLGLCPSLLFIVWGSGMGNTSCGNVWCLSLSGHAEMSQDGEHLSCVKPSLLYTF